MNNDDTERRTDGLDYCRCNRSAAIVADSRCRFKGRCLPRAPVGKGRVQASRHQLIQSVAERASREHPAILAASAARIDLSASIVSTS